MTLTVELPAETESLLQAIAAREGRDLEALVIEAINEKAAREAEFAARLDGLQELTRITEELGLYEWQLEADAHRPA